MIQGNPHEFLKEVYEGAELFFMYKGDRYQIQMYSLNDHWTYEIVNFHTGTVKGEEPDVYIVEIGLVEYALSFFVNAPLFEGKSFLKILL